MSFWSKLFRTAPGNYEWPIITAGISSGFQDVKKRWFNECVVAMDMRITQAHASSRHISFRALSILETERVWGTKRLGPSLGPPSLEPFA